MHAYCTYRQNAQSKVELTMTASTGSSLVDDASKSEPFQTESESESSQSPDSSRLLV